MATNGGSARDAAARRRRIAERGSERLALITGRVQSVSSSPVSPSVDQAHHSSTAPSPPSISPNSNQLPPSDENADSPLTTETGVYDVGLIQPVIRNSEPITETSAEASFEPSKLQPSPTELTEQNPPISISNNTQRSEPQTDLQETFGPNRLRSAITATQDIRRNCSFIAGLLVLLSYAGFPVLGNNLIKNTILSRPLFLLLLTNLTIMAAPLLLEKLKQKERRISSTGEAGFTDHLGMVLAWGMLMQAGLSALFMDCSVYSVVVVCGMSFLQQLWP